MDKCVFIDRDGVINEDGWGRTENGYVTRWDDFNIIPGVLEAFRLLKEEGYGAVIISNQKCVGRGLVSLREVEALTRRFAEEVERYGGSLDGAYYCPHLDEDGCDCRKPKPGLLLKAAGEMQVTELGDKYFIGDSRRDIQAGKAAGMKTVLVLSGKSSADDPVNWTERPDHVFKDLLEAVQFITGRKEGR